MTSNSLLAALGGAKVLKTRIRSELDLIAVADAGLPSGSAASVISTGLLTPDELYDLVIPRRTFARRQEERESLTPNESDRLVRVVRVIVRAIEILGDSEKAHSWLRRSNKALGGKQPISLLASDLGARLVEQILGRIEYGVYS